MGGWSNGPGADPGILEPGGAVRARSGGCFDAHSHIPYALLVIVENKIHIVNICMLITVKFMLVMLSKFSIINL